MAIIRRSFSRRIGSNHTGQIVLLRDSFRVLVKRTSVKNAPPSLVNLSTTQEIVLHRDGRGNLLNGLHSGEAPYKRLNCFPYELA